MKIINQKSYIINLKKWFFVSLISIFISSCTKEINLNLPVPEDMIVVEGRIENDQAPFVMLTRNQPYFGGLDLNNYEQYFISGAKVTVWTPGDTVVLDELNFPVNNSITIPVYTTFSGFVGELNKTYFLKVEAEGKTLTAHTLIPQLNPLDSVWVVPHPIPEQYDSLVSIYVRYSDPDTPGNYVRYFTSRNSEEFKPGLNSVFDDKFINSQTFDFRLERGQYRSDDFDIETYGFFWKGDIVIIKWCAVEFPHYKFWHTLEDEMNSGGPVAPHLVVEGNIEGGLGIWGGYAASFHTITIPE